MNQKKLDTFQTLINYKFKDSLLLIESLTHRSYLNENKTKKSYERLEFLGDSVLEFWISDFLFRTFPDFPEGKLTNLRALSVCTQNLSLVAKKINLGQYLFLSLGEDRGGGRLNDSILEDVFEALVGAIYLDSNLATTFEFLNLHLLPEVKKLSQKKVYKDPKSIFQEIAQAKFNITPHYQVLSESGPDHQKTFKVAVFIDKKQIAQGQGKSKQKAEEMASIEALKLISS